MIHINCIKNDNINEDFIEKIKNHLGISQIQSFFPIMENYFDIYNFNDCHHKYVLNSRYQIVDIHENDDEIIADILDTKTKQISKKDIFLKENPILDPNTYMTNGYRGSNNLFLPYSRKFSNKVFNKVNLKNNTCYIDSFFAYIGSKLVEYNKIPIFPLYYGSFCGISEEYQHDISEEYKSIRNTDWFMNNINKLFFLENNSSLESRDTIDLTDVYNLYKVNNFTKLNDNTNLSNSDTNQSNSDTNSDSENELYSNIDILENELNELDINNVFNNSDSDSDLSDILEQNTEESIYVTFKDFPTQTIIMEQLDGTLEDIMSQELDDLMKIDQPDIFNPDNSLKDYMTTWRKRIYQHHRYRRWQSILFQVCFGLAYVQKHLKFTHNDLHCDNIMFQKTNQEYLYYNYKKTFFKVPTYGYIMKIIDFGRAIYEIDNKQYFSDVFKYNNDAGGQYTYPTNEKFKQYYTNQKMIKPNYSFDLCRLSTTIIDILYPTNNNNNTIKLYQILLNWVTDKYNKNVMRFDDFDLYKIIARRMNNAVPSKYLTNPIFNLYHINKQNISNDTHIYNLF